MIRICAVSLMIGLLGLGIDGSAWTAGAAEVQIRILSPVQGTIIKGDSVEVRYELAKGGHSTTSIAMWTASTNGGLPESSKDLREANTRSSW